MASRKLAVGLAAMMVSAVMQTARAGFTAGDMIIVQLNGSNETTMNEAAQSVTLLDYSLSSGTPVFQGSHSITFSGASLLTLDGDADDYHDGHLNVSSDGQYLLIGGYATTPGTASPIGASSTAVPRVIARIDSNWNVVTTTLPGAFSGAEIDAVASDNGQQFWAAGGSSTLDPTGTGLRYVPNVGTSSTVNLSETQNTTTSNGKGGFYAPDSYRNLRIVNGQLYALTASSSGSFINRGLFATPTPLPTSGAQQLVPVMNDLEGTSSLGQELVADSSGKLVPKTDVAFVDLSKTVAGYDTAYTTGGKSEFEKWSLISGTWKQVAVYSLNIGATDKSAGPDIHALDLTVTGTGVVDLYAATTSAFYEFTDPSGYIAAQPTTESATGLTTYDGIAPSLTNASNVTNPAGTYNFYNLAPTLLPATDNTQYRGFAIIVPEPGSLALLGAGSLLLFARRRRNEAKGA